MKKTLLIILTAVIAAAAGVYVQRLMSPEPPLPKIPSYIAPLATQLPDLSGEIQRIGKWRGKILVINFWATWCPSCLVEIPQFMTLQKQYADKNVQFIGIAVDDKQAVLDYQAKTKINYPILIAGDKGLKIAKAWGNTIDSVPFTIVVNPKGRIIFKQVGEIDRDKLLGVIQPMLNLDLVKASEKKRLPLS